MDSNTWSGIALVISALLVPVVTKFSSGGVAAKKDAEEAEVRAAKAEAALEKEKRSGQRWYQELVKAVSTAKHERQGRIMDRQISERPDIEVVPGFWPPLEPLETLQQIIERSNQDLLKN
jgi:hypothetical protein